jgi:hypothetical protein
MSSRLAPGGIRPSQRTDEVGLFGAVAGFSGQRWLDRAHFRTIAAPSGSVEAQEGLADARTLLAHAAMAVA